MGKKWDGGAGDRIGRSKRKETMAKMRVERSRKGVCGSQISELVLILTKV